MSDAKTHIVLPVVSGDLPSSYAGDISADEAWRTLAGNPQAVLVDVRTQPEWNFVGIPDLSPLGRDPVLVEWQTYPAMTVNRDFVKDVTSSLGAIGRDTPILLLCRSGARSRAAAIALSAAGFTHSYNVAGGFEGDLNEARQRGTANGWKASGLPWRQS
ncbi:MAG: rhodanese-like domain-containing protein [Parvibaculaceae bacterium]|nr:rhodanese-like domain-containing protein [Parvibaculaceae bacterium]